MKPKKSLAEYGTSGVMIGVSIVVIGLFLALTADTFDLNWVETALKVVWFGLGVTVISMLMWFF